MALSSVIKEDVKQVILDVWRTSLENGETTAKEIQAKVAQIVQDTWPGQYPVDWPGLRAVQNKLAEIKSEWESLEFWSPWNMSTLDKYPLPIESIRIVLTIQNWVEWEREQKHQKDDLWWETNQKHLDVTIRQAVWISRLYFLFQSGIFDKKYAASARYSLWTWSRAYTLDEAFTKLVGKSPDTSQLDKAFRTGWRARVLAYNYFLYPKDKKQPGILGGAHVGYYFDDPFLTVLNKQKESEK